MAWPTGMPLVTITQDVHKLPDGSLPSSYAVHLQLSVPALVFDGQTTLIRRSITLPAEAGSGVISEQVPHLNHPDLSPTPVYYMVTEFADGQRIRDPWQLTPAADDVTIDLDARAPIAGDPGTPVAVGPPGPTAVSEDAGNIATLGTDGFILVDGVAVETAVEDYLARNPVISTTFKEVSNRTGATIPANTLVEIDGAFGVFSTVRVADNTTADHVAGITVAEILDGASGNIQVTGTVEGLNTSAFTAGAPLYLSTSGAWTETRPTAPAHIIRVGVSGVTHPTAGTVVFTLPAFELLAENVDGLDAKVTELAEDPTSDLGVSLSSTYGRRLATIYAADYCAEDGVTDDGPGLATAGAALVAAGGGRLVLTPGATYYVNTDATITAPGIAVAVVADTEATIQLGPDAVSGLTITGTLTQLDGGDAAYTATTVGDTTITTASDLTGSLTAGDWVMIWSSDVDNAERAASYLSGEEATVIAVDATTITLDRPIRLAHTAGATRRLYKFGMVLPTVRNLYIAASPTGVNQRPLSIYYGTDVQVDHVRVAGKAARYGIVIRQCVNVRIVRPEATDIWDAAEATSPLGYGVSVEGGVNVTVVQPFGSRVRHVFDVGSYSTAAIPGLVSHRVAVEDGSAVHTWAPAWSSHHAHDVAFVRCHATDCAGGLLVRSTGTVVRDCTVIGGHADKPSEWTTGRSTLTALEIGETVDLPAGEGPSGEDIVIDNLTVESLPSGWAAIEWVDAPGDRVSITGPDVPQDHTVVVSDSATRADGALGNPDNAYGSRPLYAGWQWNQGGAGVVIVSNAFARPTGSGTVGCRLNAAVPADVEVSARWVAIGTPGNSVCLTARATSNESDFYAAGVTADGAIAILKRTGGGGISSLVAAAAGTVVNGDVIALRTVGRHLQALVNGKVVAEADDTALTGEGRAGFFFRAVGGDGWSASQFKVRDLTHAAT